MNGKHLTRSFNMKKCISGRVTRFDILFAEMVLIFQWFNPFAWIYRREIGNNLEFLTDEQLVEKEKMEKKVIRLSLMKVSAPHFPLNLTNKL